MARRIRDPRARQRIVEVARRSIAERGLRGATVRAIAADAGVSTGYVMHYFPEKQQLAGAALALNNQLAGARVEAAAASARGLAAVSSAMEQLLPIDAERRLEWQVWVAFWTDPQQDEAGVRGLIGARRALGAILARPLGDAVADGELAAGLDLPYEAERLMTLAAGLGITAGTGVGAPERTLARRMLRDHLGALQAGSPAPAPARTPEPDRPGPAPSPTESTRKLPKP